MIAPPLRCSLLALASLTLAPLAFAEVTVKEEADKVTVKIDGQLFTEYHFKGARRPYLYPVIGPTGAGMTRDWPLKEGVAGEDTDHVHHKGLWLGHRHVNGVGFWEDAAKAGTKLGQIVHDSFTELEGGPEKGVIRAKNKWVVDEGGEVICTDDRTIRVHQVKEGRILDFDTTITAGPQDVVFGDDKDGFMAIRLAETMRVERHKPKDAEAKLTGEGHIVTSEGKRDKEAWGTKAVWCDCYGPVDGKTVGVAIFDHPSNPRAPTWWHVRTYGLFAANPFGQAQFEKLPDKKAGDFKIEAGKSVTFRYRFYFHEGDAEQGKVAERYQDYVALVK
jgi:hypothetical protein